jgi:hypothetical protein
MSVPPLPRYIPPSNSLRSVVKDLEGTAQSKAEQAKKGNSGYSGPLYFTHSYVKSALEAFLKEVGP